MRELNVDAATKILAEFERYTYTHFEIFLLTCFVNKMEGMKVNMWVNQKFGEFVAAHRVQLIFLLAENDFTRRLSHIESTLQVVSDQMLKLTIEQSRQQDEQQQIQQQQNQVQQNQVQQNQVQQNVQEQDQSDEEEGKKKMEEVD